MKFRLLPLVIFILLTASTGFAATRHIEISWAPVQAQGSDLTGFQLYLHDIILHTDTRLDQCRIEDPSATLISCDIELPDEQTQAYFTMTSYGAACESPYSAPFPVTFSQQATLQAVIDATITAGSLKVPFDGTKSTGTITHYTWNFGDPTTSTESVTDHTFPSAGTYTVSLT
ncbi:MAG: PKD domain-containing protein, partial [Desulfobulbaceae bacterium]|nr:PKD domain-containing protein [Desulfobulbaceae bacterium]